MATRTQQPLRPLRITRPRNPGQISDALSELPEPVPTNPVAPDRHGPTEDNGLTAPRAELHIALIAPNRETAELIRGHIRIVKPPLWHGGKIYLHVITEDRRSKTIGIDARVLQAVVDLGFADARDVEIAEPDEFTIGYPSGRQGP